MVKYDADFVSVLQMALLGDITVSQLATEIDKIQKKCLAEHNPIPGQGWNYPDLSTYNFEDMKKEIRSNVHIKIEDYKSVFRYVHAARMTQTQLVEVAQILYSKYTARPGPVAAGGAGGAGAPNMDEDEVKRAEQALGTATTALLHADALVKETEEACKKADAAYDDARDAQARAKEARDRAHEALANAVTRKRKRD